MEKITLTSWQSSVLHFAATFVGSAVAIYFAAHPDVASMTVGSFVTGLIAGVYNWLQGRATTSLSA